MIKTTLYKYWLPKLVKQRCPDVIPRSGEKGKAVNCFSVAIDKDNEPYLLVEDIEGDTVFASEWDGERFSKSTEINLSSIHNFDLRITHFHGVVDIVYSNIIDFTFHQISGWEYLKIHLIWNKNKIGQFAFSHKKLVTKKRLELLRFMIEDQLQRSQKGISSMQLMTNLYSIKWVIHPHSDYQHEKLELYLESLVKSEDLEKRNDEYVVTGNAINTLERFEEEERRHWESAKIQRRIVWLTALMAIFALIQTGIIDVPTILDLTIFEK